jgi:ethanolamine ammonia-lyase small subunit
LLDFRLAHARARDAVLTPFDREALRASLEEQGFECLLLESAAADTSEFLTRPDKGRLLSRASREMLEEYCQAGNARGADVCLVISNGLSARAVHENAVPFAVKFLACLREAGYSATPVVLVQNGRVAVADEVAEPLRARLTAILLGERPGLSSPNSMGVYLTYAPAPGRTNEARNCISNVRPGGLSVEEGVRKLCYLVHKAFYLQYSGFRLKDDMPETYLPFVSALPALDDFGKNPQT